MSGAPAARFNPELLVDAPVTSLLIFRVSAGTYVHDQAKYATEPQLCGGGGGGGIKRSMPRTPRSFNHCAPSGSNQTRFIGGYRVLACVPRELSPSSTYNFDRRHAWVVNQKSGFLVIAVEDLDLPAVHAAEYSVSVRIVVRPQGNYVRKV